MKWAQGRELGGENGEDLLSSIYELLGVALERCDHPHTSLLRLIRRRLRRIL